MKNIVSIILIMAVQLTCNAGFFSKKVGFLSNASDVLPKTNEIENLVQTKKPVNYRAEKFLEYYGTAGNRHLQYGLISLSVAEYYYKEKERIIFIEAAKMESPTAAAGLFHYYRGQVLKNQGDNIKIGNEAVIDTKRNYRTIYFYKENIFVKIIYSGPNPVPDLTVIAEAIANKIKGNEERKPAGFELLDVDGVDMSTIGLTPGFTFNCDFLPPSVCARAPGGGAPVSDIYVIMAPTIKDAGKIVKKYNDYLKRNGDNFEETKGRKNKFYKAVDPEQGRVIFTNYKRAVIIMARPKNYELGQEMIEKIKEKLGK